MIYSSHTKSTWCALCRFCFSKIGTLLLRIIHYYSWHSTQLKRNVFEFVFDLKNKQFNIIYNSELTFKEIVYKLKAAKIRRHGQI